MTGNNIPVAALQDSLIVYVLALKPYDALDNASIVGEILHISKNTYFLRNLDILSR